MKLKILLMVFLSFFSLNAQEIGSNFNHNPEIIDFNYLQKVNVDWIRTTPRVFRYIDKELDVDNSIGLQNVIEASKRGYKVAFGLRWDFKIRKTRIPEPNSKEEKLYFDYVRKILDKVGPYITIFKLGNEPTLETLQEDQQVNKEGIVPLVRFTQRQLTEVVLPFFNQRTDLNMPQIYVGSLHRLFRIENQENMAAIRLIELAKTNDHITGLAVHLHINDTKDIDKALKFVRSKLPKKPIIVPEFSLHRLNAAHRTERIGINESGKAFIEKYGYDTNWQVYQWYGHANTNRVSSKEWKEFFDTREWFPKNSLKIFYNRFKKYGVVLGTYPLFQQSCPKNMKPKSPVWFINPVFCQKSIVLGQKGAYNTNPLHFDDFIHIVKEGKLNSK